MTKMPRLLDRFRHHVPGRRLLAWLPLIAVLAAGTIYVIVMGDRASDERRPHGQTSQPSSGQGHTSPTLSTRAAPEVVTDHGPALPDTGGDWELFARSPDSVARLEPAEGKVTRTDVPELDSTGGKLAWSPDSAWLFVANSAQSGLHAIDAKSHNAQQLDIATPHVQQVAVRSASG